MIKDTRRMMVAGGANGWQFLAEHEGRTSAICANGEVCLETPLVSEPYGKTWIHWPIDKDERELRDVFVAQIAEEFIADIRDLRYVWAKAIMDAALESEGGDA